MIDMQSTYVRNGILYLAPVNARTVCNFSAKWMRRTFFRTQVVCNCCSKLLFGQVMKKIFKPIIEWSSQRLAAAREDADADMSSDEGIDDDADSPTGHSSSQLKVLLSFNVLVITIINAANVSPICLSLYISYRWLYP